MTQIPIAHDRALHEKVKAVLPQHMKKDAEHNAGVFISRYHKGSLTSGVIHTVIKEHYKKK